ncbi:hypothetical protein [Streptacidiphilus sp. EB129]|uniref:hypothetical protein n=1 Tax=Streptacidiphilus sp. EB129 TaxID=3156262 RepID=UPI003514C0C3
MTTTATTAGSAAGTEQEQGSGAGERAATRREPEGPMPGGQHGPGRFSPARLAQTWSRWWRHAHDMPSRLRTGTAVCLVLTVALGGLLTGVAAQAGGTWSTISDRQAPQVVDATDLYQALTDLDAQTANVLMVGADTTLAGHRTTALAQYAKDRTDADHDLQRATLDASGDSTVQQALAGVLDGMGSYQDLAARAMELNDRAGAGAGHPDPTALTEYRKATDLMRTTLLPAADRLVQADNAAFDRSYNAERSTLGAAGWWLGVLGIALLGTLIATQVWLALRFRRIVNPALAAATLITVVLVALGGSMFANQSDKLHLARRDAFDSVVALARARAVAYDGNADESRYLLDQGRAATYQDAFETSSQQLVDLPGATLSTYDAGLAGALSAYQADHTDVRFQGFLGTEFRNITFPGERSAAESALTTYQAYQLDDRKIRALVAAGRLDDAIRFGTSYNTGDSNWAFAQYDTALQQVIQVNATAFAGAGHDAQDQLGVDLPLLGAGAGLVLLLCLLGVHPRLREFR